VISIVLLVLMGMAIGLVMWLRITHSKVRRLPDTLAEICVLLAQGRVKGVTVDASEKEDLQEVTVDVSANEAEQEEAFEMRDIDEEQEERIWRSVYAPQYQYQ